MRSPWITDITPAPGGRRLLPACVVAAALAGCSPAAVRSTSAPRLAAAATRCVGAHLEAHVVSGGAEASQPFIILAVTNRGPTCSVDGYPEIVAASGHVLTASGPSSWLPIRVIDGQDYERRDLGPRPFTIADGYSASLALGTGTAFSRLYDLNSLTLTMPGADTQLVLPVSLGASADTGMPIVLTVTAFVKGSAGPPER